MIEALPSPPEFPSCRRPLPTAALILQGAQCAVAADRGRHVPEGLTNPESIKAIFSSITDADRISRADTEQITGLSTASSSRLLRRMVDEGELGITGSGKNTRYYLLRRKK